MNSTPEPLPQLLVLPTGGGQFAIILNDSLLWGDIPGGDRHLLTFITTDQDHGFRFDEAGRLEVINPEKVNCPLRNLLETLTLPLHVVPHDSSLIPRPSTIPAKPKPCDVVKFTGIKSEQDFFGADELLKRMLFLAFSLRARMERLWRKKGGYPMWAGSISEFVDVLTTEK